MEENDTFLRVTRALVSVIRDPELLDENLGKIIRILDKGEVPSVMDAKILLSYRPLIRLLLDQQNNVRKFKEKENEERKKRRMKKRYKLDD